MSLLRQWYSLKYFCQNNQIPTVNLVLSDKSLRQSYLWILFETHCYTQYDILHLLILHTQVHSVFSKYCLENIISVHKYISFIYMFLAYGVCNKNYIHKQIPKNNYVPFGVTDNCQKISTVFFAGTQKFAVSVLKKECAVI